MAINLARPKIGHFVPVKSIKIVKLIILHKYLTKNWLFSGLKKPAGLPGFEDRASGGPGLRKIGRAGGFYRPGPWLVTSLRENIEPNPSLSKKQLCFFFCATQIPLYE